MTTPLACSPLPATKRARQPSVPKTIGDLTGPPVTSALVGTSMPRLPCSDPADQGIDRLAAGSRPGEQRDRAEGEDIAGALGHRQPAGLTLDDEIALAGMRRLVRRDDAATALAADRGHELGPRAEVAPADVHRGHRDAPVARRALHDRPVDRQRL